MQASAFTDDGMSRAESPISHNTVRTNKLIEVVSTYKSHITGPVTNN